MDASAGNAVMTGYLKNEQATTEAFDQASLRRPFLSVVVEFTVESDGGRMNVFTFCARVSCRGVGHTPAVGIRRVSVAPVNDFDAPSNYSLGPEATHYFLVSYGDGHRW